MTRFDVILKWCFTIISFIPFVWLFLLYAFALSSTLILGHFPIPSLNDPKYIGLPLFHFACVLGLILTFYAIIIGLICLPFVVIRKIVKRSTFYYFATGLFLVFVQLFLDPFDLVVWLLD